MYIRGCRHVHTETFIGVRVETCIDMCMDTFIDMRIAMCMDMCVDMCMDNGHVYDLYRRSS